MSIQATNITFRHGPRFGLQDVSVEIEPGMVTGLIGPNGSGKTTLIRILCGFLKPESGSVKLLGRPLESWSQHDRARHIAYVSQTWRPVFPFTVEQIILMGRTPWKSGYGAFETDNDLAVAEEAIALLSLNDLRHEPITQLSGGELQRVMVATAVAQQTDVIILDEPTTHLDISWQQSILESLREVVAERSLTLLASIHDLNLASMYSDRIIMLSKGRLVAQGKPDVVLTPEQLEEVFNTSLDVEPNRYGNSPAISYRSPYHPRRIDAG
ncbi:MAG: ABC transporter ATP-binding protein [Candidatus Kapaibacterium sp.]